jgi:hypothetical protein
MSRLGSLVRPLRRASLFAGILTLTLVSSAFAHECYNASASAQGNLSKAEHSQAWLFIGDIRELIATGDSGELHLADFGVPAPLNACQQQAFLTAWAETGLPLVFATGGKQAVGQGGVIAENNPNMDTKLGGNGQGIDHIGVTLDSIFAAFGASFGAAFGADCP